MSRELRPIGKRRLRKWTERKEKSKKKEENILRWIKVSYFFCFSLFSSLIRGVGQSTHARPKEKKNTQKINNLKQNSSRYHADYERLFFIHKLLHTLKRKSRTTGLLLLCFITNLKVFFLLKNHQHTRNTPSSFLSCVN